MEGMDPRGLTAADGGQSDRLRKEKGEDDYGRQITAI
jgi:hypothetical protein